MPRTPRALLQEALAAQHAAVLRLASAKTSVRFVFADHSSVTVLLDREPPVVAAEADAGAEIEFNFTPDQGRDFLRGQLNLPLAALDGSLDCRGPVRKYLVVDAILRALLRRAAG